eukprot:gene5090-207_t
MANSLNGEFGEDVVESDAESFDESDGEVLLRSVFESCDMNNNGKVKVSTLLDHLLKEAAAEDNPKAESQIKNILTFGLDTGFVLRIKHRSKFLNGLDLSPVLYTIGTNLPRLCSSTGNMNLAFSRPKL